MNDQVSDPVRNEPRVIPGDPAYNQVDEMCCIVRPDDRLDGYGGQYWLMEELVSTDRAFVKQPTPPTVGPDTVITLLVPYHPTNATATAAYLANRLDRQVTLLYVGGTAPEDSLGPTEFYSIGDPRIAELWNTGTPYDGALADVTQQGDDR